MSLSDFDIQAYIDNELEWERAKQVMEQIHNDPALRARYEALAGQKHLLQKWWQETQRN